MSDAGNCVEVFDYCDGMAESERNLRHKLPYIEKNIHGDMRCVTCIGEGFIRAAKAVNVVNRAGEVVFVHRPFFVCMKCRGYGIHLDLVNASHDLVNAHRTRLPAFLGMRQ